MPLTILVVFRIALDALEVTLKWKGIPPRTSRLETSKDGEWLTRNIMKGDISGPWWLCLAR